MSAPLNGFKLIALWPVVMDRYPAGYVAVVDRGPARDTDGKPIPGFHRYVVVQVNDPSDHEWNYGIKYTADLDIALRVLYGRVMTEMTENAA